MLNIDFTFLFALLNLAILYFFVKKFLFSRLGAFMDKRSDDIAENIEMGKSMIAEGDEYRQRYQDILDNAQEESRAILEKAKKQADADYQKIISKAKNDSAKIVQDAREEAQREWQQMEIQARTQIAALAISAASKVIEQNMDSVHNQELIKQFLDKEARS